MIQTKKSEGYGSPWALFVSKTLKYMWLYTKIWELHAASLVRSIERKKLELNICYCFL
jgi:hypothetical protein